MKVVSIDPGGSNGWALWDEFGTIEASGTVVGQLAFFKWLFELEPVGTYVVEEFKLYPHLAKQQSWSTFETVQNIGAIKLMAFRKGATVIEQRADVKSIAYKQSGITPSTVKAKTHRLDAIVHGYHYFHKLGILQGVIA